jgi:hypothetical protein
MTNHRESAQTGGFDYTAAVYDYLRSLGDPGDEVVTSIRPWLERTYGLGYPDAARIRRIAMIELTAQGKIERLNTRGRYVRILS